VDAAVMAEIGFLASLNICQNICQEVFIHCFGWMQNPPQGRKGHKGRILKPGAGILKKNTGAAAPLLNSFFVSFAPL
jgi:hypothetical protein